MSAKAVRYEGSISRAYRRLNLSNVTVIALNYLELTGAPAQVRYLIKRLRQRAPHAKVMAGLCGVDEIILSDLQLQLTIGADKYSSSLNDAAEQVASLLSGKEQDEALHFNNV